MKLNILTKTHLLLSLVIFLTKNVYDEVASQNVKNKYNSNVVIIEGTITGANSDIVTLFFQKEFIYNNLERIKYKVACDSNGHFKFKLNALHTTKISLLLNDDANVVFSNIYIQPGDHVSMTITKEESSRVIFSGRQVDELNCMYALNKLVKSMPQNQQIKPTLAKHTKDSVLNEVLISFKRLDISADNFYALLFKYKEKIRPEIYSILQRDIAGNVGLSKSYILSKKLEDAPRKRKESLAQLFYKNYYQTKKKLQDSTVVYSENFIEFLLRSLQIKLKLSSEKGNYSMKDMVLLIEKEHKHTLRDRLLTYYMLSPKIGIDNQEYEHLIKRCLSKMTNPLYKEFLMQQLKKNSVGSLAYNFYLPDSNGKYFSLGDFKGNVVLIDFWFTGCSACINLSKVLENEVIPIFKDAPVIFVSICLDREENTWIKSINTGLYTSEHSINLFTEGLGFSHPLVTNYGIQECPKLLLIDQKGRIASTSPSWNSGALCTEIKKVLKNSSRPH